MGTNPARNAVCTTSRRVGTEQRLLDGLYESRLRELRRRLRGLPDGRHVSAPHLIDIDAHGYSKARTRLLVVGKQTAGWAAHLRGSLSPRQAVDHLKQVYRDFALGAHYRPTPFWDAANHLHRGLSPSSPARSFLWTNLEKFDYRGSNLTPDLQAAGLSAFNVLQAELQAAKPDVVVFFTGPTFDDLLLATLPGARLRPVGRRKLRRIARVMHASLPPASFRIDHPQYLRRSGSWGILDVILQRASETITA